MLKHLLSLLTIRASGAAAPSVSRETPAAMQLTAAVGFADLECKEGEPKKLPTFAINAYTGAVMNLSGFYTPVVIDLAGLRAARPKLPILLDHDPAQIVGQGTPKIDASGLRIEGQVTGEDDVARRVVTHAKNGFEWQASIGAGVVRREFLEAGKKAIVNGREVAGPVMIARESLAQEVSFVVIGADGQTSASVAATNPQGSNAMQFEQWLQAKGYDPAKLSDEHKTALKAAYDIEIKASGATPPAPNPAAAPAPAPAPAAPVQASGALPIAQPVDVLAQLRAENLRCSQINSLCGTAHTAIAAKALAEGWTVERTELEVLRASRGAGPAIHVAAQLPSSIQILEAALCLAQPGISDKVVLASYGEQTTNTADKYRRVGLRRTLEMAAAMVGVQLPMVVDSQWMRAAFSSSELSGIVGAVANKSLATVLAAMNPVAPRISRSASHANFHTHTVYSLAINGELEKVGADGEIKHLSLAEEATYTRKVDTRGATLRITRADIVNDDLGAFRDNANAIVRKAYVGRDKALFTLINATGNGASFFTSGNGNYFEGSGSALAIGSLSTAVQKFRELKTVANEPTMIEPKILLVPPALEEPAKALMDRNAQLIAVALGSTSSKAKEPNTNVWAGTLEPISAPFLGSAFGLSGASNTAWYVLGDPQDVPAFEIAYLNGQEQPTVDFFGIDSDANTLGATWRIYWDFGAALAEFRAAVKSRGNG